MSSGASDRPSVPGHAPDSSPAAGAVAVSAAEPLLEAVGEGVLVLDPGWRLTYVNAAAERLLGAGRVTLLGRSLWEGAPALAAAPLAGLLRQAMADQTARVARSVPVAFPGIDDDAPAVDLRCYPVGDAEGGLLLLVCPLGARERHTRELAERSDENERLRDLVRALAVVDDSAALLDTICTAAVALCGGAGATVAQIEDEGTGVFVAAAGHRASVRGHRFPLAGTLTGRLVAAHRPGATPTLLRAAADEAEDAAFSPFLEDGRLVGAIVLAPLAAHGALLGVLAVSRGLGEPPFDARDEARLRQVADHASLALWKARLVEEAQTASETKSNFLATVSHELRTPLTALTGYGELLADEIVGPLTSEQHDIVERMRAVTHQLTGMIEEILTYSSLDAGREVVRRGPVDVAAIVRAVCAVVEPLAEQKGLALRVTVPEPAPALVSDADKVRQILVNLAGNAVKFTQAGHVALTVTADADGVRVAVADTGCGIAAADQRRLFQPFTQIDTGLTRRYGGTGLGLHISQRLAHLLGGRIEVDSAAGAGSTFTLRLPRG